MRTIGFERSPAFVTLGEALRLAARYWRATWDRWLLAVIAVGLASGLAEWLLGGAVIDQRTMTLALLPGGRIDPAGLPRLMAGPLAVGIVSLVAAWFLVANALAGLRGREVTLRWVLVAGLRSFAATMLVALTLTTVLMLTVGLGLVGLVLLLGLVPLAVYAAIRLQLWTLAIFDGSAVGPGAVASWRLTRDAVLRAFGWWLAIVCIGLALAAVQVGVGFALAGAPVVSGVITSAGETALHAFTLIVLAILYESQRMRTQPPPAMAYPPAPYDPSGPYPPPPPNPPSPPGDPWRR